MYSAFYGRWLTRASILASAMLLSTLPRPTFAQQPSSITVLESTPARTLLELRIDDYQVEPVRQNGHTYQRIQVPGAQFTSTAGEPQLPVFSTLVGVADPSSIALEIVESQSIVLADVRPPPAPRTTLIAHGLGLEEIRGVDEIAAEEGPAYAGAAIVPGALASLGQTGYLRDQAVAQIRLHPVQFDPSSSSVQIFTRLIVAVTTGKQAAARVGAGTTVTLPGYEELLRRTLINYSALVRPTRRDGDSAPAPIQMDSATTAAEARLKVVVKEQGIHLITYADLIQAGLDPGSLDPRRLQMTNRGRAVPIQVVGEEDGLLDPDDYLIWYALAIDDTYTDRNIYWLEEGDAEGLRLALRRVDEAMPDALPAERFPWSVHAEEDISYWQTMPNGIGQDHYFWGPLLSPSTEGLDRARTFTVPLHNIADSAPSAAVRVRLKGYSTLAHRTRILLNGVVIDDQSWVGQILFDHEAHVGHDLLVEGPNQVTVETVETGAPVDQLLVDWIEIDYVDTYVAEEDLLIYAPPAGGAHRFELTGFSSAEIALFDITDPHVPVRLDGAEMLTGSGEYGLRYDDHVSAQSRYLAVAPSHYLHPESIAVDSPSSWRSPANGADYIIITHERFAGAAQRLASHRRDQGLRVATILVEDLYDEFAFGLFGPQALRDFLAYAFDAWRPPAPLYVLLIGDSPIDYKDNRGTGTIAYVPTQLYEDALVGQTATDNWFAAVRGEDPLPDLFIGRLSVESDAEANQVVDKLIGYDLDPPPGSWNQHTAVVADDGSNFVQLSEALVDRLPHYYASERIYLDHFPPGDPTEAIRQAFAQGKLILHYAGHGAPQNWGAWQDGDFFDVDDAQTLENVDRLSFVLVANCMNGFFAGSSRLTSMAEVLQRLPRRGAIGVFAPTDVGYSAGHAQLMQEVVDALFQEDLDRLGEATTAAKLALFARAPEWSGLLNSYVLLGDPYTRLGIAGNYPYVESTVPASQDENVAIDVPIRIGFSKPMDPASVTLQGIDGLAPVALWDVKGKVLTVEHDDLDHGWSYALSVDGKDRQGLSLDTGQVPSEWTFTTSLDDIGPGLLLEVVYDPDSQSAQETVGVRLIFDEAVRPASVLYSISPALDGALNWDPDHHRALFLTDDGFPTDTWYSFTVSAAVDLAGNRLIRSQTLRFPVGDPRDHAYLPMLSSD